MKQNFAQRGSASNLRLPSLIDCFLQFDGMGKGQDQSVQAFNSPKNIISLSPRWKQKLSYTGIRKITLLRWLFNVWYRRRLTWIEKDLFLKLIDDFKKQFAPIFAFSYILSSHPINDSTYLNWCREGVEKGKFRNVRKLEYEDIRYLLEDFCRLLLLDQRATKGLSLNKYFLRNLGKLVSVYRSESVKKHIRKLRKRGHDDQGQLPSNRAVRLANQEGGQLENEENLQTKLICWLKSLLPP